MDRIDVINNLIKNNKYKRYLEIGVQHGESFDHVKCNYKVGVDPDTKSKATHIMTSDQYFNQNKEKFDIIFIDGLHHCKQVYEDFLNAMYHLNENGAIVFHDLLPTSYNMQKVPRIARQWTGDCWKAFIRIRTADNIVCECYDFDYGVGVAKKGKL